MSVDFLKWCEFCFFRPATAISINDMNLCFNELVSNFFNCWKVRLLLLVHHENHSASRSRKTSSLLFAVIQTGPLEMGITNKVGLTVWADIKFDRIMASRCIGSPSNIVLCSSDFAFGCIFVTGKNAALQVNYSTDYFHFAESCFLTYLESLVAEF